jgi:hypothetical protein
MLRLVLRVGDEDWPSLAEATLAFLARPGAAALAAAWISKRHRSRQRGRRAYDPSPMWPLINRLAGAAQLMAAFLADPRLAAAVQGDRASQSAEAHLDRFLASVAEPDARARFWAGRADDASVWFAAPAVRAFALEPASLRLLRPQPTVLMALLAAADDAEWPTLRDRLSERQGDPETARRFWLAAIATAAAGGTAADRVAELVPPFGDTIPGDLLARLALTAPPSLWDRVRAAVLERLDDRAAADAWWTELRPALRDVDASVRNRLLGDPDVTATLADARAATVLAFDEPQLEPAMTSWLAERLARGAVDGASLLRAATHPLPSVRAVALAAVARQPVDLALALRLLESGLPDAIRVATARLDDGAADTSPADVALALLDSPVKAVQQIGRAYLDRHRAQIDGRIVARAIAEHPDPGMQAVAAEALVAAGELDDRFAARVLRVPRGSRRAKETVKRSEASRSTTAAATLIDVARGRMPRDAEWALEQLARRAATGELTLVDGVTIEGPVER